MLLEMCIAHIFCPPLNKGLGGSQIVHPCGLHRNAHGRAIRAVDEMHAPSKELLPFGGTIPAEFAPRRLPTAPGAHTTADWQGEAIDNEPVARGDAPPTFAGIQAIQSAR